MCWDKTFAYDMTKTYKVNGHFTFSSLALLLLVSLGLVPKPKGLILGFRVPPLMYISRVVSTKPHKASCKHSFHGPDRCRSLTILPPVVAYFSNVRNEEMYSFSSTSPCLSARHTISDASISVNLPAMAVLFHVFRCLSTLDLCS